jgi:DNA-nicking Smr family endonuclease
MTGPADKKPPAGDAATFRAAMADVKPIAKRETLKLAVAPKEKPRAPEAAPGKRVVVPSAVPPPQRQPNPGIDRATLERLRKGEIPIDRRIDLHGLTLEDAHATLDRFLVRGWGEGARLLLVITGKGGQAATGVLRTEVPKWLSEGQHAAKVLRTATAQPKDGGGGALYVLLRRQREERR